MTPVALSTVEKETACRKVPAGYGGACSPSDCPPYNFRCDGECVTVIGLGPGKHDEAKERAELDTGKICN
jgi:hypothetical protein